MSASKHRLYKVSTPKGPRLVQAPSVHRAISHVARIIITAEVAAPHEAHAMAKDGIEIEIVGQEELTDETRSTLAQQQIPGAA